MCAAALVRDPLLSRDSVKTTPRGLPYSTSAVASMLQS